MTKDEALKLALEALKQIDEAMPFPVAKLAQSVIKEALAQPEQEPVAWISPKELLVMRGNAYAGAKDWRVNLGLEPEEGDVGLYTTPPQRTWVGLDEDEFVYFCAYVNHEKLSEIENVLRDKNEQQTQ
jgi:hypothetical protein